MLVRVRMAVNKQDSQECTALSVAHDCVQPCLLGIDAIRDAKDHILRSIDVFFPVQEVLLGKPLTCLFYGQVQQLQAHVFVAPATGRQPVGRMQQADRITDERPDCCYIGTITRQLPEPARKRNIFTEHMPAPAHASTRKSRLHFQVEGGGAKLASAVL